jgi:predicted DNA-binding protein with PD1-like motif
MNYYIYGTDQILVRLDQGDLLVESLKQTAESLALPSAVIVSGVGMLSSIELGFFDQAEDDYLRTQFNGIFDLNSIAGNIVRGDESLIPHVHAIFNSPSHSVLGGHVMEATCHITMEIFLSIGSPLLTRVKIPGCSATQIVGELNDR